INSTIRAEVAAAKTRLMNNKQCFAVEITTTNPEAVNLKYWTGKVASNGKTSSLSFETGKGYVVPTEFALAQQAREIASRQNAKAYVDACTNSKIDLTQAFQIELAPRFELDVLPT